MCWHGSSPNCHAGFALARNPGIYIWLILGADGSCREVPLPRNDISIMTRWGHCIETLSIQLAANKTPPSQVWILNTCRAFYLTSFDFNACTHELMLCDLVGCCWWHGFILEKCASQKRGLTYLSALEPGTTSYPPSWINRCKVLLVRDYLLTSQRHCMEVAHVTNFHCHNDFLPQNRFITQIDSFESLILWARAGFNLPCGPTWRLGRCPMSSPTRF